MEEEISAIEHVLCVNCKHYFKGDVGEFDRCALKGIDLSSKTISCDRAAFDEEKYKERQKNRKKKPVKKKTKKEKDEFDDVIYTSLIVNEKMICEQIYEKSHGKPRYCKYTVKDEKIEYVDDYNDGIFTYKPIFDEEIRKNAIMLPSQPSEYETDRELDKKIKCYINKWLDVPENMVQFALWNIKRSWVFEPFHTLNYLRALGDTGLGKSRYLDVLGYIHYKPIKTSGATTSAPVFRLIEKWKGTLIMDEADFNKSDESQDIIKIINQGYEKGAFVIRCDKNSPDKVEFFDPYCPKILATRKTFTDKAVESRCITQVMTGTYRKDIPPNLNKEFFKEALEIRNMLLMWRFRNYHKIETENIDMVRFEALEPRVKQIVSSFVSLFSNDEEQMEKFVKFINKYQDDLVDERQNSFSGQIVVALHDLIESGELDISPSDIIEKANLTDKRGVLFNPRSISSTLKSLGFEKTKIKRVSTGSRRCIPLEENHINQLFVRYGVTIVTLNTETVPFSAFTTKTPNIDKNRCPRYLRNNSNTVTEINNEKKEVPQEMKVQEIAENIHLSCHICAAKKSHFWDNKSQGKPICKDCKSAKDAQKVMEIR